MLYIDKIKQMFYYYFVDINKKKSITSPVLAHLNDRLFHIHTYKFIVQNGLEFETQQKRYAILLLHINFKLVK